jgi:2-polyprenyl-6-methoxyphenol hydroxylase-like FAD-dependent oxidoreductase
MCIIILDAAHCHSPVGGQGMNLGLQDGNVLKYMCTQRIVD